MTTRRSPDYVDGYNKGYAAGARGRWPEHTPPNPPDAELTAIFEAAKNLRDAAFDVIAIIDPDTEPFIRLRDAAQDADAAFSKISGWLKCAR